MSAANTTVITASAPGKVVMSGEYAVLAGAPALVMAVNRRVHCTIATTPTSEWRFDSVGFAGTSVHKLQQLFSPEQIAPDDPARLAAWLIASGTGTARSALPGGASVSTDSREMYHISAKLGLGSSAATITALAGALGALSHQPTPTFGEIHAAHQASQGGVGSGLDIATALNGGLIRFADGTAAAAQWPADLHLCFVYAGLPASTRLLVGRYNQWLNAAQKSHKTAPLKALIDASATLANGAINLDNFARYISALRQLDDAATIGIFSPEHADIATIAERYGLLYKPCGAGGGDLGVALGSSAERLQGFARETGKQFAVIDLELSEHGLTVG